LTLSKNHEILPSYTAFGQGPKDDHVPTRKINSTCETTRCWGKGACPVILLLSLEQRDGGNLNDSRALQLADQSQEKQTFFVKRKGKR